MPTLTLGARVLAACSGHVAGVGVDGFDAQATVNEMHAEVLRKRLEMLRDRQREEAEQAQEELEAMIAAGYASA